jgi:predicted Zn-dependent peptidase
MHRLKTELIGKDELDKVKKMIVGRMRLSLESSDDIAEYYGGQEVMRKDIEKPEEKIKKVNLITAEDIKKVAEIIFNNKTLNLSIVGKFKDKGRFEKVLKI